MPHRLAQRRGQVSLPLIAKALERHRINAQGLLSLEPPLLRHEQVVGHGEIRVRDDGADRVRIRGSAPTTLILAYRDGPQDDAVDPSRAWIHASLNPAPQLSAPGDASVTALRHRFRRAIKSLLYKAGYEIQYRRSNVPPPSSTSTHEILVSLARAQEREFTFAQVGANNGIRTDPLRHVLERTRVPGVLIEPIPRHADSLRELYRDRREIQIREVAITARPETMTLFSFAPESNVPDYAHGMATCNAERLRRLAKRWGVREPLVETQATGVPLAQALEGTCAELPTLVQIDAEGMDAIVVRSALKLARLPALICFEQEHIPTQELADLVGELRDHGYAYLNCHQDGWAIQDHLLGDARCLPRMEA